MPCVAIALDARDALLMDYNSGVPRAVEKQSIQCKAREDCDRVLQAETERCPEGLISSQWSTGWPHSASARNGYCCNAL